MKISTKSRYGLRALVFLAKKGKICSIKEISDNENISFDYLEKIFLKLKKAKLVKVKRGIQGGYFLARHPRKITIGEIIKALEGTTAPVSCLAEKGKRFLCSRDRICLAKNLWEKVQDALNSSLNSLTLADSIKK